MNIPNKTAPQLEHNCPCGKHYLVSTRHAGRRFICPSCSAEIILPGAMASDAPRQSAEFRLTARYLFLGLAFCLLAAVAGWEALSILVVYQGGPYLGLFGLSTVWEELRVVYFVVVGFFGPLSLVFFMGLAVLFGIFGIGLVIKGFFPAQIEWD